MVTEENHKEVMSMWNINADGSVDAGYFNPAKISISEANVSLWK
jgi:hypothetical protein